ncbi:host specificity protein J [bacterium M00.F.Ca.ET.228.01.1.1]|nr:host specificity protein J [bacterium M00.F.Ca.ET.228.01.1.1]TGS00917.1 host specificity protein J [bacterium M00.F.Ca.ET.191.01.1.1]TGU05302.1 host specificity protein J [bacterium M00.F.Ca.ET.155.01.1.1]
MLIQGSKGGGSGSTPTESPDSLHSIAYARVLDLVSEGPIFGLVNGLQSVYLDDTPIQNSDGSVNFSNYSVDYRVGTQDQTYLPGFPSVETEQAVSVPLTSDTPWVHQVENTQLTAVRIRFGVPALQQSDSTTGNVTGYRIEYAIDLATDGGSYAQVVTGAFDGKTTTLYERSVRVELPAAATGWLVRVRRITPNAHSSLIADTVNVEAITEIIDRKLRYPMSALVGLSFDAQSFSSVPTRAYDIKGLLIRVPTNYDPEARTYSGAWDGTFKTAWSNNPAWVFYDLALNTRYGLGARIDASMVDKWGLYNIGQYCDVMVSDGKGGQEPRFTCNAVIQSQADAYKVLQDLATTFRGIAYWGPGAVVASADMPSDPVYVYTAANVVDGKFEYAGSERKTRYTTALVSWNDPANAYKQAVEYVPDEDGIARYGVLKAQITAFGVTSQGQAHRVGLWTLLTSRYETNTVTFKVGLDGTMCAPGQVIAVADPAKAGRRIGGRIRAVNGRTVTLDKAPAVAAGDELTVILTTGVAQKRTVQSVAGDAVTVSDIFTTQPVPGAVWMLESADLASQLFRVVSVAESDDDGQIVYTVNATQYEPGKYAAIDNGAAIQVRPVTVIPPSVQPPPTNVALSTYSAIDQGISKTVMVIAWDAADKAVSYLPEWRKDNGEWVAMNAVGGLQAEVVGIYQGTYLARVRAVNAMGVTSIPAYGVDTALTGKTSPPPQVTSLTTESIVFGINLKWTFPADGSAGDTQRTEIWYSRTNVLADAIKFSDFAYPQSSTSYQGLAAGQSFFFWARLVDTSGNIGPWYPAGDGVNGQSSSDESEYEAYFAGHITQTALGADLLQTIELIPDLQQDVEQNAAAITNEQQARVDGDTALSNRIDQVSAQVLIPEMAGSTGDYAGSTEVYAGVWSEQSARAEADLALAKNVETTTAQISSTRTTLLAAVQTETQARVDADSAMSSQITTVQAQANQNTAAVQTVANSYADLNGRVAASYQIKTQITANGRTYIAGIGVGVDNSSGVVESQVLVSASRFAVLDPNGGSVTAPFVIQGGQAFISQALIGVGWIQNAMIGDVIQSTALGANGQPRWKLDKNGTLTMNGANSGSGYLTISDSTVLVYDNNGTLRVRLGLW